MVMQMYKSWAQRRGYKVTLMDEMPGEIAGIKVLLHTISELFTLKLFCNFPQKSCMHGPWLPTSNVITVSDFQLSSSMLLKLHSI